MAHFFIQGTKSSDMFLLSLVGVAFETLKWKGAYIHTGSFPSIASIHRRLLASDRACRVMTPCLREREQHPADLILAVSLCLSAIFLSHLSTTSMSKQKRLSIESLFLLTHERNLNISGGTFTTPFCCQGEKQFHIFGFCVTINF